MLQDKNISNPDQKVPWLDIQSKPPVVLIANLYGICKITMLYICNILTRNAGRASGDGEPEKQLGKCVVFMPSGA